MNEAVATVLPFLIVCVAFFIFALTICPRKGKSFGYAFLCFIPIIGPFFFFYLVSLTDKKVLDRLAALEGVTI